MGRPGGGRCGIRSGTHPDHASRTAIERGGAAHAFQHKRQRRAARGLGTLRRAGEEVFTVPRLMAIRTVLLQHGTHHRGQLTVYLRLLDVPLPPLYGPTADEGRW